nr:MAG TPA: hypothetical protein [Caudoviricetes sp.]
MKNVESQKNDTIICSDYNLNKFNRTLHYINGVILITLS